MQNQFKTLNVGAIQVAVSTTADMQDAMAGRRCQAGGSGGGSDGRAAAVELLQQAEVAAVQNRRWKDGHGGSRFATKAQKGVTLTATDVDDLISYVPDLSSASIISSGTGAVLTDELDEETR